MGESAMKSEIISVASSTIKAIGYDEDVGQLTVIFTSGGRYVYEKVPLAIWLGLVSAESVGRFFAQKIEGAYPGVKVGP
jgi:hypothetical protein